MLNVIIIFGSLNSDITQDKNNNIFLPCALLISLVVLSFRDEGLCYLLATSAGSQNNSNINNLSPR